MNPWIKAVLSLSLSGALLTLILLAATRIFGKQLGRRWQYYVWFLAVLRFMLPVAGPVNLMRQVFEPSVNLKEISAPWGEGQETAGGSEIWNHYGEDPLGETGGDAVQAGGNGTAVIPAWNGTGGAAITAGPVMGYQLLFAALWIIVGLGSLARKILGYSRAVRYLGAKAEPADRFKEAFEHACRDLGMDHKPKLLAGRGLPSPMAVGIMRPLVVIPADFPEDQAYYVFLHELRHVRQRDALYKWAVELAVCIHWFNPMVYVLRRETARACELACDEAVVRVLGDGQRRIYGSVLLDTLGRSMMYAGTADRPVMTLSLGENAKWMKERLGDIMDRSKRRKRHLYASLALTAILAGGGILCGFAPAGQNMAAGGGSADRIRPAGIWAAARSVTLNSGLMEEKRLLKLAGTVEESQKTDPSEDKISWNSEDIIRRPGQTRFHSMLVWKEGYIMGLAWNVDASKYDTVRQIDGKTVCFVQKAASYADHAPVVNAIRAALRDTKDTGDMKPGEVVVLGVDGPFGETADQLAQKFYKADNITYYMAVLKSAGRETCESIIEQSYADDRGEYFASTLGNDAQISRDVIAAVAKRAAQDNKAEFFSIAAGELPHSILGEYAMDAYNGNNMEIFYLSCVGLTSEQAEAIALRAYEDDRMEYLYAVANQLTEGQRRELRERAKKDGKTSFWYALP